jgi:predicted transposase/invertase (TIGR01784 family)
MAKRRETLEEVLTELGLIPKWLEQGREQGIVQGEERGLAKGREQGLEQGALQIAQRLLKKGWSIEEVAEMTELDIKKVRSLAAGRRTARKGRRTPDTVIR